MKQYKLDVKTDYWQCGDGCCDGSNSALFINGIEVGTYGDLSFANLADLDTFINMLNQNHSDLVLTYGRKADESNEVRDSVQFNGKEISETYWNSQMYSDVLDALKLPYLYRMLDLDWELFQAESTWKLIVEVEEMRNSKGESENG